jgi:hypothetical protein
VRSNQQICMREVVQGGGGRTRALLIIDTSERPTDAEHSESAVREGA